MPQHNRRNTYVDIITASPSDLPSHANPSALPSNLRAHNPGGSHSKKDEFKQNGSAASAATEAADDEVLGVKALDKVFPNFTDIMYTIYGRKWIDRNLRSIRARAPTDYANHAQQFFANLVDQQSRQRRKTDGDLVPLERGPSSVVSAINLLINKANQILLDPSPTILQQIEAQELNFSPSIDANQTIKQLPTDEHNVRVCTVHSNDAVADQQANNGAIEADDEARTQNWNTQPEFAWIAHHIQRIKSGKNSPAGQTNRERLLRDLARIRHHCIEDKLVRRAILIDAPDPHVQFTFECREYELNNSTNENNEQFKTRPLHWIDLNVVQLVITNLRHLLPTPKALVYAVVEEKPSGRQLYTKKLLIHPPPVGVTFSFVDLRWQFAANDEASIFRRISRYSEIEITVYYEQLVLYGRAHAVMKIGSIKSPLVDFMNDSVNVAVVAGNETEKQNPTETAAQNGPQPGGTTSAHQITRPLFLYEPHQQPWAPRLTLRIEYSRVTKQFIFEAVKLADCPGEDLRLMVAFMLNGSKIRSAHLQIHPHFLTLRRYQWQIDEHDLPNFSLRLLLIDKPQFVAVGPKRPIILIGGIVIDRISSGVRETEFHRKLTVNGSNSREFSLTGTFCFKNCFFTHPYGERKPEVDSTNNSDQQQDEMNKTAENSINSAS